MKKNILIIHPEFCIRASKQIEGLLTTDNYNITVITNLKKYGANISSNLRNEINVMHYPFKPIFFWRYFFKKKIKHMYKNYDLIHCHNEPNYHVKDIIKTVKNEIPIIYDIHDFTSMRNNKKNRNEAYSYNHSDAIIHVNENFIKYGNKKYGEKKCSAIYSTPSKKYVIPIDKKKYDNKSRKLNFVYQGGIFDKSKEMKKITPKLIRSYRNYLPYFIEILEEGHNVHLFTGTNPNRLPDYMSLNDKFENFHFHGKLNYKNLIQKMNEFDYGITGFNFNDINTESAKTYLNYAMGNKLFDYIFSGIVPIVINANSMEQFVTKNQCGHIKHSQETWTEAVKKPIVDFDNWPNIIENYCIENQTVKIEKLYNYLFKKNK